MSCAVTERRYISAREVELYLGVPASTVRKWAQRGLPQYRLEDTAEVLFRLDDILDRVRARELTLIRRSVTLSH